jgi:four helix bundle protein
MRIIVLNRWRLLRIGIERLQGLEEIAYWLELFVDGKIVAPEKLSALRQECDELIAIFVTILKRSKETS